MKFIIFEQTQEQPWIMLFCAPLTHIEVARMAAPTGFRPVSAGYYDPIRHETFGESSTLNLRPRPNDSKIIKIMAASTARNCPSEAREI